MKYIKTFESYSIKKDIISKSELQEMILQNNLVTLPFFNDEESLFHHIDKNFDKNDIALVLNPSKDLTNIENNGTTAILYTKNKAYVIEDISEKECEEFNQDSN